MKNAETDKDTGAGTSNKNDNKNKSRARGSVRMTLFCPTRNRNGGCWSTFGCHKVLLMSKSASLRQLAIFELIWASPGFLLLQLFSKTAGQSKSYNKNDHCRHLLTGIFWPFSRHKLALLAA